MISPSARGRIERAQGEQGPRVQLCPGQWSLAGIPIGVAEGVSDLSYLSLRKRAGLGAVLAGLTLTGWVGSYASGGFCEPNTGLNLYSPQVLPPHNSGRKILLSSSFYE